MTYGIPYSFVPGTKAKADEVNANFIEVLSKIETTNSRIDTTNSKIDETNSLIEETNSEIEDLSTKIEENKESQSTALSELEEKLDGNWVGKELILASQTTYPTSSNINFSLSSYLPNDDNIYEVLMEGDAITGSSSGDYVNCLVYSSLVGSHVSITSIRTRNSSTVQSNGAAIIPFGTDRILRIESGSYKGTYSLYLKAYRKVS
jgi:TolA-binding protein